MKQPQCYSAVATSIATNTFRFLVRPMSKVKVA